MLKNLTLVLYSVFFSVCFTPGVSFAGDHHDKDQKVYEFKETKYKFISKLDDLLTKYEKIADSKKDSIKKDIRKLIADFLDKKIAAKKEKITKMQAEISEYEANKNKAIDVKVDFVTSDEGREKIHKQKAHFDEKKAAKATEK
ncbi:MAG: hypothetical protein LBS38_03400 [Endomicrobium sp.]|jgi:hypothetical protein|nr:hypothetical protein [Endomicrobium sp.]